MMRNEYDPKPFETWNRRRMPAFGSIPAAAELTSRHDCILLYFFFFADIAGHKQNSM